MPVESRPRSSSSPWQVAVTSPADPESLVLKDSAGPACAGDCARLHQVRASGQNRGCPLGTVIMITVSRRRFLQISGTTAGLAAAGSVAGGGQPGCCAGNLEETSPGNRDHDDRSERHPRLWPDARTCEDEHNRRHRRGRRYPSGQEIQGRRDWLQPPARANCSIAAATPPALLS